ncbi:MAG: hypothetical protein QF464_02435 [Myxococcota bacterium]|nr:hypothetical protein [Myxococcota bacterium]
MQLVTMHKALIRTAIAGGVLFCAWSAYSWSLSGEASALVMAALSATITGGMALYLRAFVRKQQSKASDSQVA